jgi:subtilisin-like proprotein convertase family protein
MKKSLLIFLISCLPSIVNAQCTTTNATTCICKNGGVNCDLLPDIHVAEPPMYVNGSSGYVEYPQVCPGGCSGNDGRLRISVSTPNVGFGPLEVRALPTAICGTDTFYNVASNFVCPNGNPLKQLVVQRIYKKVGNTMTYYDRTAGSMTYHPSHGHMHVDDWGIYTLRTATSDPNPLNWPIVGTGSKLAFCLMDYGTCSTYNGHCEDSLGTIINNTNAPNLGLGGGSYGCSPSIQGISSGYTDIYYQSLDGMWINLPAGLCNGQYWIVVQLDPYNYFLESNESNNVLATPVTLTKQSGSIPTITAGGPTTFCQGQNVTLTATAGGSYLWSNGATTQSINVTTSGNYIVTVGNGSSCSASSLPTTVTVTPVTVTASASSNNVCPGTTVSFTSSATGTGTTTQQVAFTNNTVVSIPDNNPIGASSTIAVSGINPLTLSTTSIVSVRLNLTHTYVGDLLIQLISPNGNTINLSNRRGGGGDNFVNTIFTASAANTIASGVAPFTGSFRPEAAFSSLTGNVNGNWTLKVIDQANIDIGTINNWTLTINTQVATSLSYAWTSTPSGFNSSSQNANANPVRNTTYQVTVTESGTGCIGTASVNVNMFDVTTNSPAAICFGDTATITATGGSNFIWSPLTGLSSGVGSTVKASPATTTNYRVIANNGNCNDTAFVTVAVNNCNVTLNLKAYLQGMYSSGNMPSVLYNMGMSADPTAADSITVQLRSAISPYNVLHTKKTLLHSNGLANVQFPGSVIGGNFYVVFKNRNNIETWTKLPHVMSINTTIDFTNTQNNNNKNTINNTLNE